MPPHGARNAAATSQDWSTSPTVPGSQQRSIASQNRRFEAFAIGHARAFQNRRTLSTSSPQIPCARRVVGEPADLAAAHRWAAGQRERPMPGRRSVGGGDGSCDGVTLRCLAPIWCRPARSSDRLRWRKVKNRADVAFVEARCSRGCGCVRRDLPGARERIGEARRDALRYRLGRARRSPRDARAGRKTRRCRCRRNRKKNMIGLSARCRPRGSTPRSGAAFATVLGHALVQHRMTPGGFEPTQDEDGASSRSS